MILKTLGLYQIEFFNIRIKKHYGNRLLKLVIKLYLRLGAQNKKMLAMLSILCDKHNLLKKNERLIYLIYINCLIKLNKNEKAKKELITYSEKYGTEDFNNFLTIINFIYQSKMFNDDKNLLKIFNEKDFEEYIKGKTIAIVGNGPQEIGTSHGKEIDSHDIVIRFNFFNNNGYREDYGCKTDLWVVNVETMLKIKPSMRAQNIMFKLVDETGYIDYKVIKKWQKYYRRFYYLDANDTKATQEALNKIYSPTMGFCVAIKIFNILKSFDNVDFYGFSFLEDNYKPLNHYYNKLSKKQEEEIQKIHCHKEESIYLKKIVQKKDFTN